MTLLLAAMILVGGQDKPVEPQEVVVEAVLPPGDALPTKQKQATFAALTNRRLYENSERVAKCAMRRPVDRLKAAIDGAPNSASQREAQAWLIRLTATCNANSQVFSFATFGSTAAAGSATSASTGGVDPGLNIAGYGESTTAQSATGTLIYDRGALLEQAIATFAPDLSLTPEQTADAAVQARFNALEIPRNKDRQIVDYRYFEVAVCMVRLQPRLATRMLGVAPGSTQQAGVQANIINGARSCVGNAKKVYVDPTQFRIYIIDALYRWTVAARGVTSLLPDGNIAGGDR